MVSLVLPCYGPPPGWEQVVISKLRAFQDIVGQVELILVVDGASATVTMEQIEFLKTNIPAITVVEYEQNRGKGYAIRQGVRAASGDIIIYTDIDFPYTMGSMNAVYTVLKNNLCDLAVGVKDEAYYNHVPIIRRAISRYLRFLVSIFLSMPITDTQCGLKGFNRKVVPVFVQTTIDRYLFDLEFVRKCFRNKQYRVNAIPVTLNDNIHFRKMNYRILFPEMINFLKLIMSRDNDRNKK